MSTYIGSTPWKKFKKLCMISKQIIGTYGIRYFVYVVRLELKKQGISIFLPDERPVPLYNEKTYHEKYQRFVKQMESNLKQESNSENLAYVPKISIIIHTVDTNSDLEKTLNSISNQTYQNYEIKILNTSKKTIKPNSTIAQILDNSNVEFIDDISSQTVLKNYDFAGFLLAGSVLSPWTLFKFVKEINDNKNSEIIYCDDDHIDGSGSRYNPFFKPDWNQYMFYSKNYLSPFYLIKTSTAENSIKPTLKECADFDALLQCIEKTDNILHISLPLVSKTHTMDDSFECKKTALANHLKRLNVNAQIKKGIVKNSLRVNFSIEESPKVSIIIPTKNNYKILKRCIDSIEKKTNYKNWEIIIIDNSDETISEKDKTKLKEYYDSIPYRILNYSDNFNFSKMNNMAVKHTTGGILLFLNDDTKVIDSEWLDELVCIVMQKDIGAVGPKLVYSDDTIQHAGMLFLKTGAGFHPFMKQPENSTGYHDMPNIMRECLAVTGACLATTRKIFDDIGGFDNIFDVYYGDSDLCLKIRDAGYKIIYTPFTKLLHEGSFSLRNTGAAYFPVESHQDFIKKWPFLKNGDPFYNPNLGWDYDIDID